MVYDKIDICIMYHDIYDLRCDYFKTFVKLIIIFVLLVHTLTDTVNTKQFSTQKCGKSHIGYLPVN